MNEKPLYRFENHEDTPKQKHDPGYGEVICSRENITVRRSGDVFSVWCGREMQLTSTNAPAVDMFVKGLRGI